VKRAARVAVCVAGNGTVEVIWAPVVVTSLLEAML
jgi:hypothetical protein